MDLLNSSLQPPLMFFYTYNYTITLVLIPDDKAESG